MISPKSCNNGFKSSPLAGDGRFLKNGLDVKSMKIKKPKLIMPRIAKTRALNLGGISLFEQVNAAIQIERINTQSRREPSWAPQTAEILKPRGREEFELEAT